MKLKVRCDWCGKEFERMECYLKGKKHFFCCRECRYAFSSKSMNPDGYRTMKNFDNIGAHLKELNKELNPLRMTPEVRKKISDARYGRGEGRTYSKRMGRHEHRIIAEQILGRKLKPGEIVHHIDGNKRNNAPENLLVLGSQSEHSSLHIRDKKFWK